MRTKMSWVVALLACFLLIGCNDTAPPKLDENYMKNAEALGKERREIFLRANRVFENMTPEDREKYLKGFNNDETQAKRFWELMANPPSSSTPYGMPVPGR